MNKVPGSDNVVCIGRISFGCHKTHNQVQNVVGGLVLDVSHKFNHVSFGNDEDLSKIQSKFR